MIGVGCWFLAEMYALRLRGLTRVAGIALVGPGQSIRLLA